MDAASTGVGTKLEPKRLVGIAYVAFTLAGGMFLSSVAAAIFGKLRINDPALLGIEELTLSTVIGFALAVAIALGCYLNDTVRQGSLEIAAELKRVTWPSLAETRVSTVAVVIASVVAAVILFAFDFVSSKVMTEWVPALLSWFAR